MRIRHSTKRTCRTSHLRAKCLAGSAPWRATGGVDPWYRGQVNRMNDFCKPLPFTRVLVCTRWLSSQPDTTFITVHQ